MNFNSKENSFEINVSDYFRLRISDFICWLQINKYRIVIYNSGFKNLKPNIEKWFKNQWNKAKPAQ
jgi:hypothetical protein